MIQYVLQVAPIHMIFCLKITQNICQSMKKVIKKIFLGGKGRGRGRVNQVAKKIHWIGCDTLCMQKRGRGLGLRQFSIFNQALLAKQVWLMLIQPHSLIARLFRALQYLNSSLLAITLGSKPSPYWRGLLWGKEVLNKGIGWHFGNGDLICVHIDNWLPGVTYFKLFQPRIIPPHLIKVSNVIDNRSSSWNTSPSKQYINSFDYVRILKIPLPSIPAQDKLAWLPAKDSIYIVKRGYQLAC